MPKETLLSIRLAEVLGLHYTRLGLLEHNSEETEFPQYVQAPQKTTQPMKAWRQTLAHTFLCISSWDANINISSLHLYHITNH